ncbi:MAG: branched-chain-amino-acid transaminase [Deferrisomatales bacterium]
MDREPYCLIGDELVPEGRARISAFDRGFLYGEGLFETLRLYGGRPFGLRAHWARLEASAAFLGLPLPPEDPAEAVARVARANRLEDAAVRLTLTRGELPRGPRPGPGGTARLVVQVRPLPADLTERQRRGVAGCRLPWPLRARGNPLHRHKTLGYLTSIVALGAAPPGAEPILENAHGQVAEGATSNVFWVRRSRLCTPHPEAGCLPGITRALVLDLARFSGMDVEEGLFDWTGLVQAEEAFLTNSVAEVVPLIAVDGRPVGTGTPGAVTRSLQRGYRQRVREGGEPA